ncbi:HNH endonuclease [Mycobacterium phage Archie]|uniref:HNH endonuclease n=1 Tax=Mycobacterium phage Archie TaxID=1718599 RepID=A0A0M4QZV3_9CAUD|nr:HNH endonuclease [Mycobacterium phage Archie]ALF00373.1 HNH endonuclease [Mycobacterium phage Archie]
MASGEKKCRELVYERADRFCERCCRNGPVFSVHHRLKRSHGGLWTADNCVLLCGTGVQGCHGWIEHNANAASDEGWHVRAWEIPAQVPVLYRGNDWSLLTAEGERVRVWKNPP